MANIEFKKTIQEDNKLAVVFTITGQAFEIYKNIGLGKEILFEVEGGYVAYEGDRIASVLIGGTPVWNDECGQHLTKLFSNELASDKTPLNFDVLPEWLRPLVSDLIANTPEIAAYLG